MSNIFTPAFESLKNIFAAVASAFFSKSTRILYGFLFASRSVNPQRIVCKSTAFPLLTLGFPFVTSPIPVTRANPNE